MAQKVFVEMIDDLDGSEATQTVPFVLDGVSYEIDLSDDNAANLRDELAGFVASARRTGGRKIRLASGESAGSTGPDREKNRQIRGWAQNSGYDVSARGRLSTEVIAAYEAAQKAPAKREPVAEVQVKASRKRAPRQPTRK